jgi:hypothetical protein
MLMVVLKKVFYRLRMNDVSKREEELRDHQKVVDVMY